MADGQQRILGGRYLLKDKVGTGGMAVVYRAQDQRLDRTVAVKLMLPQYAGDATFAARFKQEAQAAAGLQSPYIVGVYDWGKDDDTYYIVMEYLRGTDLKSGIRSHGALDPKKVAQIGSQICGALSVAHKHEIIHRDIKPQNIMVLPDGNIKVMDFGIARAKNSHLTQDNNVLGTAHYVSPEQTRGQELGPTSDIYSLGVVMYECATGHVPFDGDDAISVALKQVNELPVPPSQENPNVDADLERIILKCMEKDPANRFQTADELRQVLNNYLAGRTVNVAEPTRIIPGGVAAGGAVGAGATETRVMGDATQAMVRPNVGGASGATAARSGRASSQSQFEDIDSHKGGKGKVVGIVIGVLAVIAVLAAIAMNMFGGNSSAKATTVPNVLNQTQEQAVQAIKDAGLEPEIGTPSFSDTVEKGLVMDQSPDGNKEAKEGDKVTIIVSKGKEEKKVEVPKITDMTQEEAEAALKEKGLVGKATVEENDAEEGTVFAQSPNAGDEVDEGSEVEYKVSGGPDTVNVPGVLGKDKDTAANELSSAGFQVAYAEDYSDEYAAGKVMKQDVTGSAKKGTTVTLTISLGEKEEEPSDNGSNGGSNGGTNNGGNGTNNNDGGTDSFDVNSVVGLHYSKASAELQKHGIPVLGLEPTASNKEAGTVVQVRVDNDGNATLVVADTPQ